MNGAGPEFPDYGETGDRSGARRARHAFRLCVLSVLVLTSMLWVAERFLRYDHAESLYLSALTLPRESARVMLKQAIRTAEKRGKEPAAKYVQGLAVREEVDVMLDVFERAYQLDPTDSLFTLRYGCRLFQVDPKRAVEKFREANSHPPKNALVSYLEAASIAAAGAHEEAIEDAMVIVARTNNSADPVVYPKPIWFTPSALPQTSVRYAELARETVREVTVPLYAFGQRVQKSAQQQIAEGRIQDPKIWLEQLRVMGQRLARDAEPTGVGQVNVGIYLQQIAVDQLRAIATAENSEPPETLIEQRVRLSEAANLLAEFEESRPARIDADREEYEHPLRLFQWGLALVLSVYLICFVVYRLTGLRKTVWTLSHSVIAKGVWGGAFVLLLAVVHLFTLFQHIAGEQPEFIGGATTAWWLLLGAVLLFGLFYPALTLKSVDEVGRSAGRPEEMTDVLPRARRAYHRAYATLVMRYYGVWAGLYLCLACTWAVSYRILTGLYPWQIAVLTTGLLEEEQEVARQAIALLN